MSSPTSAPKPPASDPTLAPAGGVAAAYNALAPDYDDQLASAQWVRARLWERMDTLFPPGARVLDVTAGTGLDAIHLAERGVRLVACDLSPNMLAQLHAKNPDIETRVVDFKQLELELEFDGVISTFAGLNTSPDLRLFVDGVARVLKPGGLLFIHLLNRWPMLDLWQIFARRRWREGWRRLHSSRREVNLGGISVPHYLYSPLTLYRRTFAEQFRLGRVEAQGLLGAPGAEPGARLAAWERALAGRPPFHSLGTFCSLELIRR